MSTAPRPPRALLPRPALVDRIDRAMAASRPVVVRAPAGTGKSVLVAEWASRAAERVAHVELDASLDDRSAFWLAVVDALDDAGAVPPISPLRGIHPDRPGFRQDLLRGLAATDGRPVLVLDQAHLVRTAGIRDDLVAVLGLVGAPLRVVLLARDTGHDDLTGVGAAEPIHVTADDLRLDVAQAATLVGAVIGMAAPVPVLARPLAVLAGHAGTIAAAARSIVEDRLVGGELGLRFAEAAGRTVRADLDRLVQDPELRRFVARTAVVPRLPLPLAALLGEVRHVGPVLDRVAAHGLGGYRFSADGSTREFVYAPAVVAAIGSTSATERPMEHRTLLRRVVLWSVDHDRTPIAVGAAVDLDDMDLLGTVLRAAWTSVVGPLAVDLAPVLGRVALHRAADHPIVLAALARVSAAAGEHHARASGAHAATIGAVARSIAAADRPTVVFLRALEAQARRIVGDSAGAYAASVAADTLLAALPDCEAASVLPVLPFVLHQVAAAAFGEGDVEGALLAFSRIEAVTDEPCATVQRAHALSGGALVHGLVGEVDAARRMLDAAGDSDLPTAVLTRALLALEDFAPERALRLLAEIDPLFGAFEHWPIVLTLRARAAIVLGRVPAADYLAEFDAQVERLRPRAPATGTAALLLGLSRARLLLAAGQLQRAEAALDALGDDLRTAPERAGLRLVADDPARALDVVAATLARSPYTARASALLVLVRSAAERRLGLVADARAGFGAVVDVLERTGLRSVLLEAPREDVDALVADAAATGDDRAAVMFAPARPLRSVLPDSVDTVVLSERESVVLGLLAGPRSLAGIATELHVSVNTVKTQTRSVYRKLGAAGRREAVEAAHARGLVVPQEP